MVYISINVTVIECNWKHCLTLRISDQLTSFEEDLVGKISSNLAVLYFGYTVLWLHYKESTSKTNLGFAGAYNCQSKSQSPPLSLTPQDLILTGTFLKGAECNFRSNHMQSHQQPATLHKTLFLAVWDFLFFLSFTLPLSTLSEHET